MRKSATKLMNGTFLRLDQHWSWKGEPQSGSMLIGHFPDERRTTIHWIDIATPGGRAHEFRTPMFLPAYRPGLNSAQNL